MKLRFKYGHPYPYYKPFLPRGFGENMRIRILPQGGENLSYGSYLIHHMPPIRVERIPINFIITHTGADFL